MTKDIKNMSVEDLKKFLAETRNKKGKLGLELRAQESHNQKDYRSSKTLIAQILTELKARELTNQSN